MIFYTFNKHLSLYLIAQAAHFFCYLFYDADVLGVVQINP
jgi:hypothetical protein